MMLSKSAEYGIRASLYLSSLESAGYVSIRLISEQLGISGTFLTKIFQKLTVAGILSSYRGPKGGVVLARPPEEITLFDVYVAIDGETFFNECMLGLPGCGERTPCPMHDAWASLRGEIRSMFVSQTLAALHEGIRAERFRLADVMPHAVD